MGTEACTYCDVCVLGCRAFDVAVAVHTTTFASPRVGNRAFARSFSKVIGTGCWNLFNDGDIVHHIPIRHYKHADNKVRIDKTGTLDLAQDIDYSGVHTSLPEVRAILTSAVPLKPQSARMSPLPCFACDFSADHMDCFLFAIEENFQSKQIGVLCNEGCPTRKQGPAR